MSKSLSLQQGIVRRCSHVGTPELLRTKQASLLFLYSVAFQLCGFDELQQGVPQLNFRFYFVFAQEAKKKEDEDLLYDAAGWLILAGVAYVWFSILSARGSSAPKA